MSREDVRYMYREISPVPYCAAGTVVLTSVVVLVGSSVVVGASVVDSAGEVVVSSGITTVVVSRWRSQKALRQTEVEYRAGKTC
jgi:hypothetical protein